MRFFAGCMAGPSCLLGLCRAILTVVLPIWSFVSARFAVFGSPTGSSVSGKAVPPTAVHCDSLAD